MRSWPHPSTAHFSMSITIVFRSLDHHAAVTRPGVHASVDGTVRAEQPSSSARFMPQTSGGKRSATAWKGSCAYGQRVRLPRSPPRRLPGAVRSRGRPASPQPVRGRRRAQPSRAGPRPGAARPRRAQRPARPARRPRPAARRRCGNRGRAAKPTARPRPRIHLGGTARPGPERPVRRRLPLSSSPASASLSRWCAASVRATPAASAASLRPTSRPCAATYSYRRRRTGSCNAAIASMSSTRPF